MEGPGALPDLPDKSVFRPVTHIAGGCFFFWRLLLGFLGVRLRITPRSPRCSRATDTTVPLTPIHSGMEPPLLDLRVDTLLSSHGTGRRAGAGKPPPSPISVRRSRSRSRGTPRSKSKPKSKARSKSRNGSRSQGPRSLSTDRASVTSRASLASASSASLPRPCTAKAWVVTDAAGNVLCSHNADNRRQIASITKVMTAWLVVKAQRLEPDLLSEWVLVSAEAAAVGGTSARLHAGEVYSVEDLLYGMLLPSGNDAAFALAEYLGDSFEPETPTSADGDVHPHARFVAEMNREAVRLGLEDTTFGNAHGLSNRRLQSTASDVALMVSIVMQNSFLRRVCNCKSYTARAKFASGGKRAKRSYPFRASWTNSNTLLGATLSSTSHSTPKSSPTATGTCTYLVEGVKTGITGSAGGCLATRLRRVGSAPRWAPDLPVLYVVVLGSSNARTRFSDSAFVASNALATLRL